jgi:transglutaminase-like putative cysteine protease
VGRNYFGALRESGAIDYILAAILGSAALFALGEAVYQLPAAIVQILLLCVGLFCSFLISTQFRGSSFLKYDGVAYSAAAIIALGFQRQLSSILPGDPYPPEMVSAGLVSWMIVLGGFAAWRDNARLFQAVPALATFALVGVYDTFPPALFVFFIYLISVAVMFGRAHVRAMLVQASRSGFAKLDEGISITEAQAERDSMVDAMRRGPWRAMAGLEWAFASAGLIIVFSLVVAPVVQDQLKGISGWVPFRPPSRLRGGPGLSSTLSPESLQSVGTGPKRPNDSIIGVVTMDESRNLRVGVYDRFYGRSWAPVLEPPGSAVEHRKDEMADLLKPGASTTFKVALTLTSQINSIYLPAPAEMIDVDSGTILSDGVVSNLQSNSYEGDAIQPTIQPGDPNHPEVLTARHIAPDTASNPRSLKLAIAVTKDKRTDWDKAEAIMKEIDRRAKYNLRAKAVPANEFSVDYFLFDSGEGYCDLFASAMAVMARDIGLDARYVVGYIVKDDDKDENGRFQIRQSDAHSWCEIYFNDIGWVTFDATTGAQDVTPSDAAERRKTVLFVVAGSTAIAGVALGAWFVLRRSRRIRLPRIVLLHRNLDRAYGRFARELGRRSGKRREVWMTPDAWLAETGPHLGSARVPAEALNAEFVRALYASGDVGPELLDHLWQSVKAFRKVAA